MSPLTPSTRSRRARRSLAAVAALTAMLAAGTGVAQAAEVQNGSFETGDLSGWTADDDGAGDWIVYSAGNLPGEGAENPFCGTYAVGSDQGDPTSMVLYQDIALEAGNTHTLSFRHYWVNENDDTENFVPDPAESVFITPPDLSTDVDNQQYRVDIMDPDADIYSVADDDVLAMVFRTDVGDPDASDGWLPVEFDLSPWAGQTVRLRFAVAVTEAPLHAGIDCVAVQSTPIGTSTTSTTTAPSTTSTTAAAAVVVTPTFTG